MANCGPGPLEADLRVTIQALGWRTEKSNRRYLPLQDDIASVAYWYQSLPPLRSRHCQTPTIWRLFDERHEREHLAEASRFASSRFHFKSLR